MELIFMPNVGYAIFLVQPLIYGLYYKQTRQPMMKLLKSTFPNYKFDTAVVAPQQ